MSSIQRLKDRLNFHNIWEKTMVLDRWEYIKREHTINTNLYFLEKGCVHVYFLEQNKEHSMYFGTQGFLISDLTSFLSGKESSLIIRCLRKTVVRVVSKERFEKYIQNGPAMTSLWVDVLSELSVWQVEREKDLMCTSSFERLRRLIARQPELLQRVPHKYLASHLGMTPENLSRIQKY